MTGRICKLIGAPVQDGAGRRGCDMGPAALRAAGLAEAIAGLGYGVADLGTLSPPPPHPASFPNPTLKNLPQVAAWVEKLAAVAFAESADGIPVFMGGDHSLSAGTIAGLARRAALLGRKLFVLWLDAHPDFHTLHSTESGNIHGTPLAYLTGQNGFAGGLPPLAAPLDPRHVAMLGIRSVDAAERQALAGSGITVFDMRAIDEHSIAPLLRQVLERVRAEDALLHVSLDVDFLDPAIAPAVGTTVPGGASFREAHLVMEMLHDSGRVTSLDLVELNPFLDERGRTATLLVDLVASLFGRRVLDRPTRSF
ncbi:MAG: arginase [Rhodospirillales bacterium]|nr:arginase [Rhodospirillales bacterium]